LVEIAQRVLQTLGLQTTEGSIRRFFKRHGISFKKKPARRRTGSTGRGSGA
jgi:transposase